MKQLTTPDQWILVILFSVCLGWFIADRDRQVAKAQANLAQTQQELAREVRARQHWKRKADEEEDRFKRFIALHPLTR